MLQLRHKSKASSTKLYVCLELIDACLPPIFLLSEPRAAGRSPNSSRYFRFVVCRVWVSVRACVQVHTPSLLQVTTHGRAHPTITLIRSGYSLQIHRTP
jgi:hypothetical protein